MAYDGLRNSGIPLGGLGTGSVELRRDGYFYDWQIMNNRPWGAGPACDAPPDSAFFGIHVQGQVLGAAYRRTAVLGLPAGYETTRYGLLGHFLNDPYHMPWLEQAERIEAEARFPFTRLAYDFGEEEPLPVAVTLEAFSPFIPLDAENSGLPLALFTFTLRNRSADDLAVSLLAGLRNLTGYTYAEQPSRIAYEQGEGATWLRFDRENLPADASDAGTLAIGVLEAGAGETSYVCHPRTVRDVWDPFHSTGRLENVDIGDFSGPVGNMGAERLAQLRRGLPLGALCHTIHLPAGAEQRLTFALAWHFPNFIEADYPEKKRMGQPIGHRYSARFDSAPAVLRYAAAQFTDLEARTRRYFDAFYASALPAWLLEAASAQLTTLIKSSWWDRQGRFGIWEGLGCCGLQTTDITYYGSFPIVQFFPEIEQSQMRLTRDVIETPGKVPHMLPGNFSTADVDHRGRIDLIPQYILLVWRDVRWTGDLEYARQMWPSVKEALAYFSNMDTDGDGLPNNSGPDQTYDQFPLKGTSAFVGFLYAASLRAAADLARLLGEEALAAELETRLSDGLKKLDDQLWTGEYYRLCYDLKTDMANEGVMADQVSGDWFVRQASGAGLLPDEQVRSALRAVLEFCSAPRGYIANCAWPFGGAIEIGRHTSDQANSPWSGVEYALAAHLAAMGLRQESLQVGQDVWLRYERAGLRFNHIECGANYYRALSAWALYLAHTGFAWDAPAGALTLAAGPKVTRYVVNVPSGWGDLECAGPRSTLRLHWREGQLRLQSLRVMGLTTGAWQLAVDGKPLSAEVRAGRQGLVLQLAEPLMVQAGQRLELQPGTSPR